MYMADKSNFVIVLCDMYKSHIMSQIQSDWIQTNATITNIEKKPNNKFMISYTYEINYTHYKSTQLIDNQNINIIELITKMNNNTPIDIYYNLYDWSDSCIHKSTNLFPSSLLYPCIAFILILIILNPIGNQIRSSYLLIIGFIVIFAYCYVIKLY